MRNKIVKFSHQRLLDVLSYDQSTGEFRWLVKTGKGNVGEVAGSCDQFGYRRIMIDGERVLAHRLAWFYVHGVWPDHQIDHINVDNTDNSITNLREATQSQNQANKPLNIKISSTGYKGVSFHKKQDRFFSRIRVDGKLVHLGCFKTAEEAHAAYVTAANYIHGEFARVA